MDEEIRILEREAKLARYRWRKELFRRGLLREMEEGDIVELEAYGGAEIIGDKGRFIFNINAAGQENPKTKIFRAKLTNFSSGAPFWFEFLDPELQKEWEEKCGSSSPHLSHFPNRIKLIEPGGLS